MADAAALFVVTTPLYSTGYVASPAAPAQSAVGKSWEKAEGDVTHLKGKFRDRQPGGAPQDPP